MAKLKKQIDMWTSFKCKKCGGTEWRAKFLKVNHKAFCTNCGKYAGMVAKRIIKRLNKDLYSRSDIIPYNPIELPKTRKTITRKGIHRGSYKQDQNGQYEHRIIYYTNHVDAPKSWHIHHIDCNKSNNNIENLIALPSAVHIAIHDIILTTKSIMPRDKIQKILDAFVILMQLCKDTSIERVLSKLKIGSGI